MSCPRCVGSETMRQFLKTVHQFLIEQVGRREADRLMRPGLPHARLTGLALLFAEAKSAQYRERHPEAELCLRCASAAADAACEDN